MRQQRSWRNGNTGSKFFALKGLETDWRKTGAFYEGTIGANPDATLTIRTFPDGNHNIDRAKTGGLREMSAMQERVKSAGYYGAQVKWLQDTVLRQRIAR